jgi:phage tail-like protein
MARSSATDMLDTFRFQVQVDGFVRAGFAEVTAPSVEIKVREYVEAGRHMNPLKITESASFPDIILNRGLSTDSDFLSWVQTIYNTNNKGTENFSNPQNRKTIQIFQYNRSGQLVYTYVLYNCIPVLLKIGTDFNAMEDAISMESLKIAYEGFSVTPANGGSAIGQTLNNLLGSNLF